MGGVCYYLKLESNGKIKKKIPAPKCTDNFQIVSPRFVYLGYEWHSVEQAFQALKFPEESLARNEIHDTAPEEGESDRHYGGRMWSRGQLRGDSNMRDEWELVKVKVMYMLNLAKYASNSSFQTDLIETTENFLIVGLPSTPSNRHGKSWKFWNENIQMAVRNEIASGNDLLDRISNIEHMTGEDVERMLMKIAGE